MAKIFLKITSLFLACITTCFISLVIIVHDPIVLDALEARICKQASVAFDCDFNARIYYIDLAKGLIFLSDVVVLPQKGRQWRWTSDSISVKISWFRLLKEGCIYLDITCGSLDVDTQFLNGTLAIADHLVTFTRQRITTVPMVPERVGIPSVRVRVHIDEHTIISCSVSGAVDIIDNQQQVSLSITQDQVSYREHTLIRNIALSVKKIKDLIVIQGSAQLRNSIQSTFCPGQIKGTILDNHIQLSFIGNDDTLQASYCSKKGCNFLFKNAQGSCSITTQLKGKAELKLQLEKKVPFNFQVHYEMGDNQVKVKIADEKEHVLDILVGAQGDYSVEGNTDFFNEIFQKVMIGIDDKKNISKYIEFLSYRAPLSAKGSGTSRRFTGEIDLSDLQVRIPYTYNFLRSINTTCIYAPGHPYLFVRNSRVKTDRGHIRSGLSTLMFDDYYHVKSAHIPLIVQDFFINQEKDFFAEIFGAFIIDYRKDDQSKIQGVCTLKKCHIRNNPFSGDVGGDIISATINPFVNYPQAHSTDLELTLRSYEPVDIKTPFLQARAQIMLQALGTIAEPRMYGQIEIINGTFNFPYKALEITNGKIFFVDNLLDDPSIEICATAFIKNYAITMYAEGTARQPIIVFHSTPSLQEEQIISLLFGGAPDSSLSLVMPLSSMATIEKLIVGSPDESIGALDTFKNWLGSLQKVKIVPRFSDQTSRGGLRGALAIEVNENLSALIQQNFSLTEDTLLEVAYKPLDELTIRGMRDERGDLGGEIEARFSW